MSTDQQPVTICTAVHGEKFEQMYEMFRKVILRWMPDARIIPHRYIPPGRYEFPAHAGDWGKAEATSVHTEDGPIFIMDVDSVLVKPIRWNPKNKEAILSICASEDFEIVLPRDRCLQVIQDVARDAGLLGPDETCSVNPQFFWATENLLPLYEEMDSVFYEYQTRHGSDAIKSMWSLTVWTLVWLKLKAEGKIEPFPCPHPVWHCPMRPGDRASDYKIFTDYIMSQPIDISEFPPMSLFG